MPLKMTKRFEDCWDRISHIAYSRPINYETNVVSNCAFPCYQQLLCLLPLINYIALNFLYCLSVNANTFESSDIQQQCYAYLLSLYICLLLNFYSTWFITIKGFIKTMKLIFNKKERPQYDKPSVGKKFHYR